MIAPGRLEGPQKYTAAVLVAWVMGLIVWDVYAIWRWGTGASVSWVTAVSIARNPILAVGIGILLGHFLGVPWAPRWYSWANWRPLAYMAAAVALGAVAWTQTPGPPTEPGPPEKGRDDA